ncbi:uncharacterized protein LOC116248909 isoform X1 [Nymphaea colorata]|nr:uncharacterized protein LOC116248909 isoform X1 [Nymphaea colorata]
MAPAPPCPKNAARFNSTLCACAPGYLMEAGGRNCTLSRTSSNSVMVEFGVSLLAHFPNSHLLLQLPEVHPISGPVALIVVLSWITFAVALGAGKVHGRSTAWFRLRHWISQMYSATPRSI